MLQFTNKVQNLLILQLDLNRPLNQKHKLYPNPVMIWLKFFMKSSWYNVRREKKEKKLRKNLLEIVQRPSRIYPKVREKKTNL